MEEVCHIVSCLPNLFLLTGALEIRYMTRVAYFMIVIFYVFAL